MNPSSIAKKSGRGIAIRGNDIDTDRIIPARYMKAITFAGLGKYAFIDERMDENGTKKGHPFDDPRFQGASILVANKNFGCGSSREHAPQALHDWGIQGIVGESFAEIFAGNCTAMGVPIACVSEADARALADLIELDPAAIVTIDVERQKIATESKGARRELSATIPSAYRNTLLDGTWDSTGSLLANLKEIEETRARIPYVRAFAET